MSRTRSLSKLIGPSGSQASVKATSFVGDASSLTGLPAGYADSDVASYILSNGISNIVSAASEPSVGSAGKVYYNTTLGALKISDGSSWVKVTPTLANLSSISGTIHNTIAGNITLLGTGFLTASCVVTFTVGATEYTVTKTADNDTTISAVAVPAGVYNSAGGTSVLIKVTNSDNKTSGAVSTTVIGLPTGGTITTSGGYRIHTFTSSSSFVVASPTNLLNVQYVVVAGGGGGGYGVGGGGGAGGYRSSVVGENSGGGLTAEGVLAQLTPATYTVTIGGGGSLGTSSFYRAGKGGNSVFHTITSLGGGGGGNQGSNGTGETGGSGSGSAIFSHSTSTANQAGTAGQGYAAQGNIGQQGGTGGGGAGGIGGRRTGKDGGDGGIGVSSSINGTATYRAGGGAGGGNGGTILAVGGLGGGGQGSLFGSPDTSTAGTANTGGGGGGGGGANVDSNGKAGGSGIVIIRYAL